MKQLTHFDTFSGYGGFTMFAEELDIKTIGFSEVEPNANKLLQFRFPNIKNYGDVTKIDTAELPDFDILTGGTPCQNLSNIGNREGLSGAKSGLFYSYIKILREKHPDYFVWENVKGAFTSNDGWDFAEVQNQFSEAEYNIQWQLLNARAFGIPQNRERVFIFGCHRKARQLKIFPLRDIQSVSEAKNKRRNGIQTPISSNTLTTHPKTATATYVVKIPKGNTLYDIEPGGRLTEDQMLELVDHEYCRPLVPIEYERIMGLPDDWTKYGMDNGQQIVIANTGRYKLCGNGIVPQKAKAIYEKMIEQLK